MRETLSGQSQGGQILGLDVLSSISSLPRAVDVAVIILPAAATAQALRECAEQGIRHFVLSSGGFAEVDETGSRIQDELVRMIKANDLRVLGPNTSGHTSTPHGFTSTFFPQGKIRRGRVSYIAQTGNFGTHTLKYIMTGEHFGVARVVGLGNKIGIDETDALEYLGDDPETAAILIYIESFKRPLDFLKVAREVTRKKPVVLLKSGATEAGRQAAMAHTAAMASPDRIVDGMLRQAGVVRITDYTHLIQAGKAFSMLPLPGETESASSPLRARCWPRSPISVSVWDCISHPWSRKTCRDSRTSALPISGCAILWTSGRRPSHRG